MWALKNQTSYAAQRSWIRDKNGHHHWLVAVRATFQIQPSGRLVLADEQLPPVLAPEYRGDPATTSLLADSDLLYLKPTTDVIVDASAHAPRERPASSVPVALRVADVRKTLIVHGLRVYYQGPLGLATSSARPFVTAPIHYESAFGGSDTSDPDPRKHRIDLRNPVGKGFGANARRLENQVAHSVEYPAGNAAKVGPAGFGPVASFWSPRREHAGTYDARWEKAKKPLLPDDYDDRFALSAPEDQRPRRPLRGGEQVQLVNLTPEGALSFDLPKIFLAFRTDIARRHEEHRATLTTVYIATEQMRLGMVWQTSLPVLNREMEALRTTIIREKSYLT